MEGIKEGNEDMKKKEYRRGRKKEDEVKKIKSLFWKRGM